MSCQPWQLRRVGDRAVLICLPDRGSRRALDAQLAAANLPGVIDVVPGDLTVLVRCDSPDSVAMVWGRLPPVLRAGRGSQCAPGGPDSPPDPVVVDSCYDGPDLAALASGWGCSSDAVVGWHTRQLWTSEFTGFMPGFAYLTGPDPRTVPRRDEPRSRIPAGSIAVAGEYSAVYPAASPGGWQLIGHTDRQLWDLEATPPALLAPGTRVRFRAVRGQ